MCVRLSREHAALVDVCFVVDLFTETRFNSSWPVYATAGTTNVSAILGEQVLLERGIDGYTRTTVQSQEVLQAAIVIAIAGK